MTQTITITLTDERAKALRTRAEQSNLTLEEVVLQGIDAVLSEPDETFEEIARYVVDKNSELYRRLA